MFNEYSIFFENLPLTFVYLTEWILVRLEGKDIIQYLHNQFTCDIKNLKKTQYTFSAHCNPQGKTISNMYVFHFKNVEMAFIQRKSVCKKQIKAMEKYAVFSKITIIPDYNIQLIGIFGKNAKQYLNTFFTILPDHRNTIIHDKNATLLYFNKPIERFLLIITNTSILHNLLNQSKFKIKINKNHHWIALDIAAGYPWIELITSEIFIPQVINMDILQGISFNKGCYIGQEPIARIQYRGNNKKKLFQFISTLDFQNINKFPKSGNYLKIKTNYQTHTGIVLQTSQINKNNLWIQAIFNNTIAQNNHQQPLIIKIFQTNNDNFNLFE